MTITFELTPEQERAAADAAVKAGFEGTVEEYLGSRFASILADYARHADLARADEVKYRFLQATEAEKTAVVACLPPPPPPPEEVKPEEGEPLVKP